MKKLLILDGNSIINRAFYGVRLLTDSKGRHTNGVYGFLNIFLKILKEESWDYVSVAFDLKAPTFRHKMYSEYKANRHKMPDELAEQMPYLKQILTLMGVPILEKEGYEADDIIGTVSKICEQNDTECVILTGDRDDLQLCSSKTTVRLVISKGGKTDTTPYNEKTLIEELGVTPLSFIDVKAIMGDTSDNIPGVKGIGEKGAYSLIREYGSLDNVYENIQNIKGAMQKKLIEGKDTAYLSKTLATIDRKVPLGLSLSDFEIKNEKKSELLDYLTDLDLKSIVSRLDFSEVEEQKEFKAEIIEISSPEHLKSELTFPLFYTFDTEDNEILRFSFTKEGKVYIKEFNFAPEIYPYLDTFREIFEKGDKISINIKEQIVFLKNRYDITYNGAVFDLSLGAYLSKSAESSYSLSDLAGRYLNFSSVDKKSECAVIPLIYEILNKELSENGQRDLFYNIEMPLCSVLADMEIEGFKVDRESLSEYSKLLDKSITKLQTEIFEMAGHEFNIHSPKQLGIVLFEELKLPVIKKSKTGYSTNAEVLEKLRGYHEIIEKIMDYRTYTKLKSTYADGLFSVINPETGKIHSSFNQTVTATGRISSTEPNLQNIPVRIELGRRIRKMFIASSDDRILIDADYSQIELRVLAHIAHDEAMIKAFEMGKDIHAQTASSVFKVPLEEVTPFMRTKAKAVNFGIVYGIGDFSLSQDLKVTRKQAGEYIKNYLETYSGIAKFMEETVKFARENGYVKTEAGRRRYIPEIKDSNFNRRSFGERVAMNAPIQGYAADIIKIAMVKVHNRLKAENLKSKLILQVHDELIIDALKSEQEKAEKILKEEMENAVKLSVPLVVDMKAGKSWYDTK